jgi:hypothetical protein
MYDTFYHPLLGDINCIRTLRQISAHEELFVDYACESCKPCVCACA